MSKAEEKIKRSLLPAQVETDPAFKGKDVKPSPETELAPVPTRTKIGLPILRTQYLNKTELEQWENDLFSGLFDVSKGQDKGELAKRIKEKAIADFEGLTLDYWEKKVFISLLCHIDKQKTEREHPIIYLDNKSELYGEVLEYERGSGKGYKRSERQKFDEAIDKLQTSKKDICFWKTVEKKDDKKGKKGVRRYCLLEGVLIKRMGYLVETGDKHLTREEIKNKGKLAIEFDPILLEGLKDNFRLIPKNFAPDIRRLKYKGKKITRVRELDEAFCYWLHSHAPHNIEIKCSKGALARQLHITEKYKAKRKRTTDELHRSYEIAKQLGYLTDYKTDQKGTKGNKLDIFSLNPDSIYHLSKRKEKQKGTVELPDKTGVKM